MGWVYIDCMTDKNKETKFDPTISFEFAREGKESP